MLLLNTAITNLPVASVQSAHRIGEVTSYVIDPRTLTIAAFFVQSKLGPGELVLHLSDVKDFSSKGLVIDHNDQLMERDQLVRLDEIIGYDFNLLDKPVATEDGAKLGKVAAFAFDTVSGHIMKLYVRQPIVKNVSTSDLIIARQQIVKVTDSQVIVKSAGIKVKPAFSLKRLLWGEGKPAPLNAESKLED